MRVRVVRGYGPYRGAEPNRTSNRTNRTRTEPEPNFEPQQGEGDRLNEKTSRERFRDHYAREREKSEPRSGSNLPLESPLKVQSADAVSA